MQNTVPGHPSKISYWEFAKIENGMYEQWIMDDNSRFFSQYVVEALTALPMKNLHSVYKYMTLCMFLCFWITTSKMFDFILV